MSSPSSLWTHPKKDQQQQEQQRLYGRSKEIKQLLEAYSRCKDGNNHTSGGSSIPECVLITGASGIFRTQFELVPFVPFIQGSDGHKPVESTSVAHLLMVSRQTQSYSMTLFQNHDLEHL